MIVLTLGNVGYGKTSTLVSYYKKLQEDSNILFFRPSADFRTRSDRAESHNGEVVPAIPLDSLNDIHEADLDGVHAIFIDDLHYFDDKFQLDSLKDVAISGVDIYCAARDIDDEGDPIEHVGYMTCIADHVLKLVRTCDNCGRACRYSYCNDEMGCFEDFVEDLDQYDSLCEHCFYDRMGSEIFDTVIDTEDEHGQSVEITIYLEEGNRIRFNVSPEIVGRAGWSIEEIQDITTNEGVNRLFMDIQRVGGLQ